MDLLHIGIYLPRDIGTERLPWSTLRRFIEFSPPTSALWRAREAEREKTHGATPKAELEMLRRVEFWTHLAFWAQTKDAQKGKNRPAPVDLGSGKKAGKRDTFTLDQRLLARQQRRQAELDALARSRKLEGRHGG